MSYLSHLAARALGLTAGTIRPRLAPYFGPEFEIGAETRPASALSGVIPRDASAVRVDQSGREARPEFAAQDGGLQPDAVTRERVDGAQRGAHTRKSTTEQGARPGREAAELGVAEFSARRSESAPPVRPGPLTGHEPEVRRYTPERQAQPAPSAAFAKALAGSRQENSPGSSSDAGAPAVHVHIGRVDVRVLPAVAQSTVPPVAGHRRPAEDVSLEAYLRGAKGGGR